MDGKVRTDVNFPAGFMGEQKIRFHLRQFVAVSVGVGGVGASRVFLSRVVVCLLVLASAVLFEIFVFRVHSHEEI